MRVNAPLRHSSARRRGLVVAGLVLAAALLTGCGENYPAMVKQQHDRVTAQVRTLGQNIASGRIRNANLISQYASIVRRDRPDLAPLTSELAKEGTTEGMAYASLANRLTRVNLKPKDERAADTSLEELLRIEAATDPSVFNDSLIDVVNVLADLSKGKLARLHVPASAPAPQGGAGGHLVGNPRYGNWQRGSSGSSFWVFYGQYALMSHLFFPRRYSYNSWYGNRGWSYYGNVGRRYYGSRADTARWNRAEKTIARRTPARNYGPLRSQRRLSTYGRTASRSPGSAVRRASSYSSSARGSSRGSARSSRFRGK